MSARRFRVMSDEERARTHCYGRAPGDWGLGHVPHVDNIGLRSCRICGQLVADAKEAEHE